MFDEHPLDAHIRLVETVAAAGVAPPAGWQQLHDRMNTFLALTDQTLARDDVTAAVISGDPDVPMLRCLALAEVANQMQLQTVHGHVRNVVHQHLRELYDSAAAYAQVAELFNRAATDFTAAAQLADPETDPAEMVTQPDKPRKAWHNSESHANQLSRLIDPLAAAASLAGVDGTDSDTIRIPLCANVDGHHCRKLWTAWLRRDGRCNRWSALHQLGVEIRAANLDGGIESYREPKAMEVRVEPILNADGRVVGSRRVPFDPEDGDVPQPIDPRRRQGRVTTV